MDLKEKAMVVNLTISQWGAEKKDDKVTREIEALHKTEDAGRFTKRLMKSAKLDNLKSLYRKARSYHREVTLPWGEGEDRIILNDKMMDYMLVMGNMTMQVNEILDEFVAGFKDQIKMEAIRLNGMFNATDYPHPDLIRDKFKLKATFFPIADADDFRLAINDSMAQALKSQITNEVNNRVNLANQDVLNRVKKEVQSMIEKLTEGGQFRADNMIGKIMVLKDVIPTYNFMNDKHIDEVVGMLDSLIVDPELLKGNEKMQKELLKKATTVLEKI